MRRPRSPLLRGLLAFALLTAASVIITSPVSAVEIAPTTTCNNGFGNGGAVCEVTVVNTITPSGGSAVVTVRECQGSAGDPNERCTNTTTPLSEPVTAVTQCNGSINGGGGTLLCSILVTNNFVGITPPPTVTDATVNQCNGSVTTGTVRACSPDPATTDTATITQCNGSGNGGGASLTCTASGTQSSGLAVTINQCNGSSNGGGTRTVCSANITNNVLAASTAPSASVAPSTSSVPNTGVSATLLPQEGGFTALMLAAFALLGSLALLARGARRASSLRVPPQRGR